MISAFVAFLLQSALVAFLLQSALSCVPAWGGASLLGVW